MKIKRLILAGLAYVLAGVSVSSADTLRVKAKRDPGLGWKLEETRTVESLNRFKPKRIKTNAFGSRMDCRQKKTGFFHAVEKDGRWWLVDPEGYLNINVSVVSVNMGSGPSQKKAFPRAFGSEKKWANKTVELLRENGFNGTGAWSDDEQLREAKNRINYCVNWKFMSTFARGRTKLGSGHVDYPADCIPVFDPDWESFCERHAKMKVAGFKDDPCLVGHFFDNELPLKPGMIERFLELPKGDAGYLAARNFMESRKGKGAAIGDLKAAERDAFDDLVMEKYMGTIARAIRKVDPNHMLLGPRLYSRNASMGTIGKYVDAFAYNLYGKWSPAWKAADLAESIGKPLLVTEFYAKGMDVDGLSNESGAGWCVPTQEDRGLFYQNFALDLLESKVCIGWHWFRYQDNDPGNTKVDASNLNANKGIVNNDYEPYEPLLTKMKELNTQVYALIDYFDRQ
ncbi:hypothetical protein PDESU_00309 [Pontiella desulfatans]|uniref:Agarase n=1 Tax=Pontiella desulfatans TaxID=2750659 RepID=A0A6C2TVY9_PONDE|nr:agarase [Pontiella desulfatans]VGO11763.1 hypothetical protein PDESU_00309 [Pontiella desulfatans]